MASQVAPYQWQAEPYEGEIATSSTLPRGLCVLLGLFLSASLSAVGWFALSPVTAVETRFVADLPGPAGRAALAEAALRLAANPALVTNLESGSLVVTVTNRDAPQARTLARSIATTVLDMPRLPQTESEQQAPAPAKRDALRKVPAPSAAVGERARLQASLEAVDSRLGALSTALTGVARDLAATARASPDRRAGREALDRATLALAGLQLQRIQLQSRYQDDFPAVAALDGQIRAVHVFIGEETRRVDAANRAIPDLGDPILSAERDRLRAEQSQLLDRRAATATELAVVGRLLADRAKVDASQPQPPLALAFEVNPTPMLIEAATTVASGPDQRWWAVPVAAGSGLLVLFGAWLMPRRRNRALQADPLLQLFSVHTPTFSGQQAESLLVSRTKDAVVRNPWRESADVTR